MNGLKPILSLALSVSMCGCFTGVESTPKITAGDLKKQKIVVTPEQEFLSGIAPETIGRWTAGKRFYVTDDKISIIFTSSSSGTGDLAGTDLIFSEIRPVTSVTGEEATELIFTNGKGADLHYRINASRADLAGRSKVEIPFTVERSVVDQVDNMLRGNTYYVTTPRWYDESGKAVDGLRHVPVTITSVVPGNHVYPLKVGFSDAGGSVYYLFMSVGDGRTATRNFDTLFSFGDPRKRYDDITDEVWDLIIHSKVREGMSRDECRLALGAPQMSRQVPTTAGIVEYWTYDDGVYLMFDNGILARFRK